MTAADGTLSQADKYFKSITALKKIIYTTPGATAAINKITYILTSVMVQIKLYA